MLDAYYGTTRELSLMSLVQLRGELTEIFLTALYDKEITVNEPQW